MIITPFIYPVPDPALTSSSTYQIPGSTLMVYSKGNPFLDTFYIPSRLIPTAQAGHTFSFQAQHDSNIGLYPAALLPTSVYVTQNALYGFQDVGTSVIAMIVTATTVSVGYRDVDTNTLVIISNIPLVERPLITEDMSAVTNPKMLINRQLTRRQTVAPNNLPFNITSHHVTSAGAAAVIYFPPDGTSYSYLNIKIKNPTADELTLTLNFTTNGVPRLLYFKIIGYGMLSLNNVVVAYNEAVAVTVFGVAPTSIYVGAMHMEGRI